MDYPTTQSTFVCGFPDRVRLTWTKNRLIGQAPLRSTSQQGFMKNRFEIDGKLPSVLLFMNLAKDQF
jgi:hypothetical protein